MGYEVKGSAIEPGNRRTQLGCLLPQSLVHLAAISVGLTLVLAALKLDLYTELPWWIVLLPVTIALVAAFLVLTMVIGAWVVVAVQMMSGKLTPDDDQDFRLDMVLRTAKICFLGHGYISLLMVSLGLFLMKLGSWAGGLPVVYPLLPLAVLGLVYIVLAVTLKQPEVDTPWYFLVGSWLLSQSLMLVMKCDHARQSEHFPWAAVFTPSWLVYVLLLIYCVLSPLETFHQDKDEKNSTSASSADTHYGGAEGQAGTASAGRLPGQLLKVAGIFCWVVGWGLSQVLLALRLDALYKVAWLSVILPALLGWILFFVFVRGAVCEHVIDKANIILDTFALVIPSLQDPQARLSP